MDRLGLLQAALDRSHDHIERWGEHDAILSIIAQLEYLEGLETRRLSDRSHLSGITLGVLAVREIEGRDMPLADILHRVSAEAGRMREGG
jgi:hypothetical protein